MTAQPRETHGTVHQDPSAHDHEAAKTTRSRPSQGQAPFNTETNQTAPLLPKYKKQWMTALARETHRTAHQDPRPRGRSNHEELTQSRSSATQHRDKPDRATTTKTHEGMDDSPTQRDSWDGTPRLTTTRPLKPRGVGPIKVKRPQHRDKPDSATTANTPSEGIDDSPTQRGSWDGAPGPSTTRSLKPRGVDAVKVKRHSTNRTRERHFYNNIPSEGMDDSPTQRGSWDGTPKPTTTRSLKPRGVDAVKVKGHSLQRQTRQTLSR